MPGFDKKGPMGQGEMTGRGLGNCEGEKNNNCSPRGGGMGRRCGSGNGRGMGQGRGFGRGMKRGMQNWCCEEPQKETQEEKE